MQCIATLVQSFVMQYRLATALPNVVVGGRMVNSIEYNYRVEANYTTSFAGDYEGFGNFSIGRTGDRFDDEGMLTEPYNIINASIGVQRETGRWLYWVAT